MKTIDLTGTIRQANGEPLKESPSAAAPDQTFADAIITALQAPDQTVSRPDSIKRFVLAVRMQQAVDTTEGKIDLTSNECTTIKNVVHKVFASPPVDAALEQLIEGAESPLLKKPSGGEE